MQRFKGIIVSEGLARGEAFVVGEVDIRIRERKIPKSEVAAELEKLEKALRDTRRDISELKEKTRSKLGEMGRIIETYVDFLNDEAYLLQPIRKLISNDRRDAVSAVASRFAKVTAEFRALPEPIPSRIPDLLDVQRRVINHLLGRKVSNATLEKLPRKVVVVADDLAPTQTATLDRERVLAFATDRGGPASHTAILARHLAIPAIVGLGNLVRAMTPGDSIIIDGLNGEVIVNPDEETLRDFESRKRKLAARRPAATAKAPVRTTDGHEIELLGNIDNGEGAKELKDLGVRGVGLFRTEYLYLGRADAPDEDQQAEHYARLVRIMAPHPVAIRTMDFGADKWDHRVGTGNEPNPFLGMRAIRLSFAHENVFRAQVRAILRASASGNVRVMFPMITDVAEFRRARAVVITEMEKLREEGVAFDEDIEVGAMIEVPAAALTARSLLREADFVSLGSNDLTQYTLAVDRTNPLVADHFTPHHPAVLSLIRSSALAAKEAGKTMSACGEMAGSARYAPVLLGCGIHTLSMAASRVPEVVDRVRRVSLAECEDLAEAMIDADDAAASNALLDAYLDGRPQKLARR